MKKNVKVSWLYNGNEYFGVTIGDADGGQVLVAVTPSFNSDLDSAHAVVCVAEFLGVLRGSGQCVA
jgi:hypothetical protein